MNFSILTPLPPIPGYSFLGGWGGRLGGGGQNYFEYYGRCVCIWTQVRGDFFPVHGRPNLWRGSVRRSSQITFSNDLVKILNSKSKNLNLPMTKYVYSLAWNMDGHQKPQSK